MSMFHATLSQHLVSTLGTCEDHLYIEHAASKLVRALCTSRSFVEHTIAVDMRVCVHCDTLHIVNQTEMLLEAYRESNRGFCLRQCADEEQERAEHQCNHVAIHEPTWFAHSQFHKMR